MQILKLLGLLIIFISSTYIGILISNKYQNRVKDLKEMKNALNIFCTKIKFTYEVVPKIFIDISNTISKNVGSVFKLASDKMNQMTAGQAWSYALENSNTNMKKDDIEILKPLGNLLGKVDIDGQINEIKLAETFLDTQIEEAEEEKNKYTKMYKTLGITIGFAIVIILI